MGLDVVPPLRVETPAGWAELTRHAPGSHVASLRIEMCPLFRGRGLGRRLVQIMLVVARLHHIKRVEATPYTDNPGAVRFFDGLPEFQHEGIRRCAGRRDGRLVDTHLYAWVA